ncbi:toll/interleukin-1 receptor domain-containing protein [Chitinophaga rhizophila]|uniref:Toll/interleukin-1 receptor domain-containing protein n=1 Tax=Chitinophaga rhizophila TaxID=2866212 RepID=A0ABS7GHT8_9BACT|nr:toll/interleukin-1 receptor domain-containing protein [Chitinophaga rhizophila]MBW8687252.1 toll/interleukin-1 receptor domain-containing protein [Chitinophaga rhizophila]
MTINEKLNKILAFLVEHKDAFVNVNVIHKVVFQQTIPVDEAARLLSKIIKDGHVEAFEENTSVRYILETEMFLEGGGYGGIYKKVTEANSEGLNGNHQVIKADELSIVIPKVFASYAWGDLVHERKVMELVETLRKNGLDAQMDKMLSQQQTAINFKEMMVKGMQYDKVLVFLSPKYKDKADAFTGGVGTEFRIVINDMEKNPKKYILVSFDGRGNDLVPLALQGYDVVNLSSDGWWDVLIRKLTDQEQYVFSPVTGKPPVLPVHRVDALPIEKNAEEAIAIETTNIRQGNSSSSGGLYNFVEFDVQASFKNISGQSIKGFGYEIKIRKELMPELYNLPNVDGYLVIKKSVDNKLFNNQSVESDFMKIKIMSQHLPRIIGTNLTITVHSEFGSYAKEFPVNTLFATYRNAMNFGEKYPLGTPHMFQ